MNGNAVDPSNLQTSQNAENWDAYEREIGDGQWGVLVGLDENGEGYVRMPKTNVDGLNVSKLKVEVEQIASGLDPETETPIIDLNYNDLYIDGAIATGGDALRLGLKANDQWTSKIEYGDS